MLRMLLARLRHGRRTIDFPPPMPALPARYRGRPVLDGANCAAGSPSCGARHTAQALRHEPGALPLVDLGASLFCPDETGACPEGALRFGPQYAMATRTRDDLRTATGEVRLAAALAVGSGEARGCSAVFRPDPRTISTPGGARHTR